MRHKGAHSLYEAGMSFAGDNQNVASHARKRRPVPVRQTKGKM